MIKVIKKDGTFVDFNENKIIIAIRKSAERVSIKLTEEDEKHVVKTVLDYIYGTVKWNSDLYKICLKDIHLYVESALDKINKDVAESYRNYRNYKVDFVQMMDEVYQKAQSIMYLGDKENSNTDSALVTTKRSLVYNELNKELYNKFFLNVEERQACRDGYIYIHDKAARRDTMNCCLFDAEAVMTGGFEMGNMFYAEPKSIDTACDVLGDIIMMSASMQYGGWSTRVDTLLAKYCEKSYIKYKREYISEIMAWYTPSENNECDLEACSNDYAYKKTIKDLEQGVQGLEYKLNSVASSRGDYPFTTFALGLDDSFWGQEVSKAFLRIRKGGQGKEGFKRPVLFPKLVFLYDEKLHDTDCKLNDIFEEALDCSSKCMYPDFLSLTGKGYVSEMYLKHSKVVYPMG